MGKAQLKLPIRIPIEVDEELEVVPSRFEGVLYVHYFKQGELVRGTSITIDRLPDLLRKALKSYYFADEDLYDEDNGKELSWDDLTPEDIIEITKICIKKRRSEIPGYEMASLIKRNGRWMWVAQRIFGEIVFTAEGGVISDYNPYTKETVFLDDKGNIMGVWG